LVGRRKRIQTFTSLSTTAATATANSALVCLQLQKIHPKSKHPTQNLRENPQIDTVNIHHYILQNAAVLNAFRHGLPLCTSVTAVSLEQTQLGNDGFEGLLPVLRSMQSVRFGASSQIQRPRVGALLRTLLAGNNILRELNLFRISIDTLGPEGVRALGQGIAARERLRKLDLYSLSNSPRRVSPTWWWELRSQIMSPY
jgi:hypothetical protein